MSELVAANIHQARSLEFCSHQRDDQMLELVTAYTPDTSPEALLSSVWWPDVRTCCGIHTPGTFSRALFPPVWWPDVRTCYGLYTRYIIWTFALTCVMDITTSSRVALPHITSFWPCITDIDDLNSPCSERSCGHVFCETDFHTIFWWWFRWEILRESVNTTSSAVTWRQHFQNHHHHHHHQNHHCCHYHYR